MIKYLLKGKEVEEFNTAEELIRWLEGKEDGMVYIQNYEDTLKEFIEEVEDCGMIDLTFAKFIGNATHGYFEASEEEVNKLQAGKIKRVDALKHNGDSKVFLVDDVLDVMNEIVEFFDDDARIEVE